MCCIPDRVVQTHSLWQTFQSLHLTTYFLGYDLQALRPLSIPLKMFVKLMSFLTELWQLSRRNHCHSLCHSTLAELHPVGVLLEHDCARVRGNLCLSGLKWRKKDRTRNVEHLLRAVLSELRESAHA